MLIDINELQNRDEPLVLEVKLDDGDLNLRSHVMGLEQPVHSELKVALLGDQVLVAGSIQAGLEVICSRCLKPFGQKIQKTFELEYRPDPTVEEEGEVFGLAYTDLSIGFYRNHELDVSAMVSEQIVFEIPMKPVCKEVCKGLCDQCGADLNEGNCSCENQTVDPRLAVLADFKKTLNNYDQGEMREITSTSQDE